MADTMENDIVALLGQGDRLLREFDPETSAHQDDRRRPPLPGNPLSAPVTGNMHSPFYFHIRTVPDVIWRHEMTKQPALIDASIQWRMAGIDPIFHDCRDSHAASHETHVTAAEPAGRNARDPGAGSPRFGPPHPRASADAPASRRA